MVYGIESVWEVGVGYGGTKRRLQFEFAWQAWRGEVGCGVGLGGEGVDIEIVVLVTEV